MAEDLQKLCDLTRRASAIWAIYRIAKGMLNFHGNKPMYA